MSLQELYEWHLSQPRRRKETALGLRSCEWLQERLTGCDPDRVADFGSGMSTLAIRQWAQDRDVTCITTDHEKRWLDDTREQCEEQGLSTDHFYLHDTLWAEDQGNDIDFVFMDLADMWRRISEFERAFNSLNRGGKVVWDDWHKEHLRRHVIPFLNRAEYEWYEIPETEDQFGRYLCESRKSE